MRIKLVVLFFLVVGILAACGPVNNTNQSHDDANHADATNDGKIDGTNDETDGIPDDQEQTIDPDEEADVPDEDEEPAPDEEGVIAQDYYMNKNYIIKPKSDNSPAHVVLLTFDDGPKSIDTLQPMLDILNKHKAKAIFFVNGYRVKAHPELLKLIDEAGQIVGNHSWDHIMLGKEEKAKIDQQIEDVQQIVEETIGVTPLFFRPPFASSNDYVKQKVKEENMLYMTWSNGSLDWDPDNESPEKVIQNVFDQLHPGSNILMHELQWTVDALDELLTKLEEAGYGFVDPRAIDIEYVEPVE